MLANNPEGISEVANDINRDLTNFWRVLQDDELFADFKRRVEAMPFSEVEWESAATASTDTVWQAVHFFVRCRQSLAGRMDGFAPLSRNRIRRGMNEQASAWLSSIDGLPPVHNRLRRVVILCKDGAEVIRQQDGKKTLHYVDPPFHPDTRTAKDVYEHEMNKNQHELLLKQLSTIEGKFMLSCYRCEIYDAYTEKFGWKIHEMNTVNHAAGGKKKRGMVECIITNY